MPVWQRLIRSPDAAEKCAPDQAALNTCMLDQVPMLLSLLLQLCWPQARGLAGPQTSQQGSQQRWSQQARVWPGLQAPASALATALDQFREVRYRLLPGDKSALVMSQQPGHEL